MAPKLDKIDAREQQLEELLLEIRDLADDIKGTLKLCESLTDDITKVTKVKVRISRIDSAWTRFSSLAVKAKALATSLERQDNVVTLAHLTGIIRDSYYDALALYDPYESKGDSSQHNISSVNVTHSSSLASKLPTINIPTFNGDVSVWVSFKDTYSSLIHDNEDLSPIQKFHYLKGSLKGNALQSISAIAVTAENYPQAWSSLLHKYDSKRLQATHYLTKIFNFTPSSKLNLASLEEFSNVVLESAIAFKNIELADSVGFILTTFALRLLDPKLRDKFETICSDTDEITFSEFVEFIHKQCTRLQTEALVSGRIPTTSTLAKTQNKQSKFVLMSTVTSADKSCLLCKDHHRLFRCPIFKKLTAVQRWERVKASNACTNCLSPNHTNSKCTSSFLCRHCNLKHHTWLHFKTDKNQQNGRSIPNSNSVKAPSQTQISEKPVLSVSEKITTPTGTVLSSIVTGGQFVLLGTALARIQSCSGEFHTIRLVIDSGSQRSIITDACAKRLGLRQISKRQGLLGLANSPIDGGRYQVSCLLIPRNKYQPQLLTDAVVVSQITSHMPAFQLPYNIRTAYSKLELADPTFYNPGHIDFLLGADLFGEVICEGSTPMPKGYPKAISTVFGAVILGNVGTADFNYPPATTLLLKENLPQLIERFWQVEEVSSPTVTNPQDVQCENYFVDTHTRTESGRYVVRLPFKNPNNVTLGNSYFAAAHRYQNLENRLYKSPALKKEYSRVLQEYLDRGYMSPAVHRGIHFLPHHGVLKDSTTTKLRIVFDASMKTSGGSLNDHLLTGPKLHLDIKDIIMNFRKHPIVLTADICQMFLQIIIHPSDRKYQHILYSFDTTGPVREFELNTLTFGMSSSPYLAIRVLRQLSLDEGMRYPQAAHVLLHDIYVDDILTGADSVESAIELQNQLVDLLAKGGFALKKWTSNSSQVLAQIPDGDKGTPIAFAEMEDPHIKILGIVWDPVTDNFSYRIKLSKVEFTKRSVLSIIARLYDPVGYLAPVIFKAKALLQELWTLKLDWDTPLPDFLRRRWNTFLEELPLLSLVRIPRCILPSKPTHISVVGFADASSLGYASVIYIRWVSVTGEVFVYLLTAKTRLAPLKTLSIPRLELCAAHLLAKTLSSCKNFFASITISSTYLLSDSSTVLGWLSVSPHTLKVFVANRVVDILQYTALENWYHVPSVSNPADPASRGETPANLHNHTLWWEGPQWLKNDPSTWSISKQFDTSNIPESKPNILLSTQDSSIVWIEWMKRFSSLTKLQRSLAYVYRFINNVRTKNKTQGTIKLIELNDSLENCIKLVQRHYFGSLLASWEKDQPCKELQSLSPFIDTRGVLRVGGRLKNSPLSFQAKHPILLPTNAHFTKLLIDQLHVNYLHAGPQLLHSLIQRKYWVISARRVMRSRVHQCQKCHRLRATSMTPFMADLPKSRFQQGRAFINVGVDFAGPFLIRDSNRRKANINKCYICIFVCMATKAIHIELVSQLSTDAFLASLDRFIARRGAPAEIFSDHGTNFVGAVRRLKEVRQWLAKQDNSITEHLNKHQIRWSFIPPAAPHFGGLWEAGVKSFKTHLVRILGAQPLTFEEFNTIAARIEAMLNSRPLYPISASPEDYEVLTPGHFLIGAPLREAPQPDLSDVPINRLSRWQFLQRCMQDVWRKWRLDYLNNLQQRGKWRCKHENPKVGTLVLLRDPNCPRLEWPAGRIMETYPGQDGVVRVVKVKTCTGQYVRSVTQLAPLLPSGIA